MILYCLHGSIQTPEVWSLLPLENTAHCELIRVSLEAFSQKSISNWIEEFHSFVKETSKDQSSVILGYSLGGRLALHSIAYRPEIWKAAIVISANPGEPLSKLQKKERSTWNENWAQKFLNKPWDEALLEWNDLPIFSGFQPPVTNSRPSLGWIASTFRKFSVLEHPSLRSELESIAVPRTLFVAGEQDLKYTEIGKNLESRVPNISFIPIPNAGHRVPWDNSEVFINTVKNFLDTVSKL